MIIGNRMQLSGAPKIECVNRDLKFRFATKIINCALGGSEEICVVDHVKLACRGASARGTVDSAPRLRVHRLLFIFRDVGGWCRQRGGFFCVVGPSAVLARDSSAGPLRISWLLSCVNASSRKYSPVPTTGGGRVSRQAITRGPANKPPCCCALRSVRVQSSVVLIARTKELTIGWPTPQETTTCH
jgi:hypothetical protein